MGGTSFDFPDIEDGVVVRRYMNFAKFMSLLESRALYFAPASQFQDPYEGTHTDADEAEVEEQLRQLGFDELGLETARRARETVTTHNRQAVLVSCWNIGDRESRAMWKEYGEWNEAVAIACTVGDLREALPSDFCFVPVTYVDATAENIPQAHSLQPFFYKRKSFENEEELRIVCEMKAGTRIGTGWLVAFDVGRVVRTVVISPAAPPWFSCLVPRVLERYGVRVEVRASSLTSAAAA